MSRGSVISILDGSEQLALRFGRRHELPPYRMTWREGERTIVLEIGARCHDESWPHWQPLPPWARTAGVSRPGEDRNV